MFSILSGIDIKKHLVLTTLLYFFRERNLGKHLDIEMPTWTWSLSREVNFLHSAISTKHIVHTEGEACLCWSIQNGNIWAILCCSITELVSLWNQMLRVYLGASNKEPICCSVRIVLKSRVGTACLHREYGQHRSCWFSLKPRMLTMPVLTMDHRVIALEVTSILFSIHSFINTYYRPMMCSTCVFTPGLWPRQYCT